MILLLLSPQFKILNWNPSHVFLYVLSYFKIKYLQVTELLSQVAVSAACVAFCWKVNADCKEIEDLSSIKKEVQKNN